MILDYSALTAPKRYFTMVQSIIPRQQIDGKQQDPLAHFGGKF